MTTLPNFVCGRWQAGSGAGTPLFDPVLGTELVRVDATGLDLGAAFAFAREQGGAALRALTYRQRAALLAAVGEVLQAHRDAYCEIATANSGTVKNDSAVDIDGGIFTLATYAKLGDALGDRHHLLDGALARLGKDPLFQSQHVMVPTQGVALFINAFNFPSWGLWEKAAPALLSGVPVIVKPATATAWLTQRMVRDVVDAGVLPAGALSVICGSSAGLMDQLQAFDLVSFTGSAETAAVVRSHPAVAQRSVRMGSLVNRAQLQAVQEGLALLKTQAEVLHDGATHTLVDADPAVACCTGPTLLGLRTAAQCDAAHLVHDTEVFGPVATLLAYRDADHALALLRRGQGSLVTSLYGSDATALAPTALQLASSHGRVHAISPDVAALHTGHGNVMPQSMHGGPGRAGGGEELGGLRALNFYHRRSAVQASTAVLAALGAAV